MSSVSVPRRYALLTLVAVASFAIFKCGSINHTRNREVFCLNGNYSESRPLICVNERTLTASPSHARIYDIEAKHGLPTGRPVTIHWFAQHTADLRITMNTESCTEPVTCDGLGHCWTRTLKLAPGEKSKVCKYGIMLGDKSVDPEDDIILTPCCS